MKSKIENISKSINGYWVVSVRYDDIQTISTLRDEDVDVSIKKYREKRSLDANGYLWVLCGKLADKLHSTKWEVYKEELKKWSTAYTYMIVAPEVARSMKARENDDYTDFRCVEILNQSELNGKPATQILAYFGSHLFDSKEMSTLIDGVVQDCKEQDIETKTPDEIERMKSLWDKKSTHHQ